MKKLWTGIMITAMAFALQVNAALYTQDFTTDPGSLWLNGFPAIGATGSLNPYFEFGEFAGSHDIYASTDTGVLHLGSADRATRTRGVSVWIDTSTAVAGTYTVSFDVSNFTTVAGSTGFSGFKVFEGSGLDAGWIDLDNIDNATNGSNPKPANTSTAPAWTDLGNTWGASAAGSGITGDGTVSFDVELTEAGVAGDYLALAWVQVHSADAIYNAPSYDVDNISVAIPEPATLGMIASFGVGILFIRRRLTM